jgi:glycosyltransferase involved in cell wall biosynthesis
LEQKCKNGGKSLFGGHKVKLSIIIPNYNSSKSIGDTLDSLIDQRVPIYELIVIDDASTDNSLKLIKKKYPKVKIYENKKNLGAAFARNLGIKKSNGDYILFVDADVVLSKNTLSRMIKTIKHADIVFPKIVYKNGLIMYPNSKQDEKYLLISPAFLMTRRAINKLRGLYFDENYRIYGEDTDFFLKCKLLGLTCLYIPDAEAVHVVNKPKYREERYYLEVKNNIYGTVKYFGFKNINELDHCFKIRNIVKLHLCGFFNFNLFDAQAVGYDKSKGSLYKALKLFRPKNKIINKNIFFRLSLTINAIIRALPLIPIALRNRRDLKLLTNKYNKV